MTPPFWTADFIVQIGALLFSIGMLVYGFLWNRRHINYHYVSLPFITYFFHVLVFYITVIYAKIAGITLQQIFPWIPNVASLWSSVLRLHSMTTCLSFLVIASACIRNGKPT